MTEQEMFPHGKCECRDGCRCEAFPGPAAFEVVRDGKKIRVCTRCELSSRDTEKRPLWTETDSIEPYMGWDPLGAICMAALMLVNEPEGK